MGKTSGFVLLAFVLAAFGGGLALGVALQDDDPAPRSDLASGGSETEPPPDPVRAGSGGTSRDGAEEPRIPAPQRARLSRLVQEWPTPEPARGTGVIHGHIRLPNGDPLPGVVVHATPVDHSIWWSRPPSGAPPTDDDWRRQVQAALQRLVYARALRRETKSGADGRFSFEGLPDAAFRLAAYLEGYQITGRGYRIKPDATVDFQAKPVVPLDAEVVHSDGTVPRRAEILFVVNRPRGGQSSTGRAWTPERPTVYFHPGVYKVHAELDDLASKPVEVELEVGDRKRLVLRLEGRTGLRGRVLPPEDEEPVRGARVYLLRSVPGSRVDHDLLRSEGKQAWVGSMRTGFEFTDLEPGLYVVGAGRTAWQIHATETVEVVDGRFANVDLRFPPLERSRHLVVRAVGPDGKPLKDLRFALRTKTGSRSRSGGGQPVRKRDGTYWLRLDGIHGSTGPDTEHFVVATSGAFGTRTVEYAISAAPAVTVRFDAPGSLRVSLPGYVGSGLEGHLRLALAAPANSSGPRGRRSGQTRIEAAGTVDFAAVAPGTYDLVTYVRLARGRTFEVGKVSVTVRAGSQSLSLPLPRLHALTVVVGKEQRGKMVTVRTSRSAKGPRLWTSAPFGEDGRASFPRLPPGTYQVSAAGKTKTVNLEGDAVVGLP